MTKENIIPVVNQQKLVEEVRELEENSWWKEYQNSINKSNLSPSARSKIIKKSGSDFVSERGKGGYGPMPFVDEATALIVARTDDIMNRLEGKYPNIVKIFKHNPKGTVEWLKAEGALVGYNVVYKFEINFEGRNDSEQSGIKAWKEYKNKIKNYVTDICKKWKDKVGNFESRLRPAIEALSEHIHNEHEKSHSYWPEIGGTIEGRIELDTGGVHEADCYYIVWNCRGWMEIKDERPRKYVYRAEFRGEPDIKILQLDGVLLGDLNRRVLRLSLSGKEEALKSAKAMIDAKQGMRDPSLLTWEDFK